MVQEPVPSPKVPAQPLPGPIDVGKAQEVIFKPTPGPQTEFLAAAEQEVLYGGAAGGGKVLADEGVILTPFGWKKGIDLKVGDIVCHPSAGIQKIVLLHPRNTYTKWTVHFSDGTSTEVAEEHLWEAWKSGVGVKKGGKRVFGRASAEVVTTKTLADWLAKGIAPQIPVTLPLHFTTPSREVGRIDPYQLGVLLGDGCLTTKSISISTAPEDKEHWRNYFTSEEITWTDPMAFRPVGEYRKALVEKLKSYGLLGTDSYSKFIPKRFLWGTLEDRWALFQGLMDTDGWSAKDKNAVYFDTVSPALSEGVQHLVRSLGGTVTTTSSMGAYKKNGVRKECQEVYHLYIRLPNPDDAFRMKRKQFGAFGRNLVQRTVSRVTVGGELIGRCITVSNPDGLYITNDFIVTHNSFAMVADPVRNFNNRHFKGLLLRRTTEELRELISVTKQLYPQAIPGIKFLERDKTWVAPSGASLWMSYLDADDDVMRYTGQAFSWVGFDELTQWASPYAWNYMRSRLRTTSLSGLKLYMRGTTNPGGPGHAWVKKMFVDPAPPKTSFWATDIETGEVIKWPKGHSREGEPLFKRRFIPATLFDNPYLASDGMYEANLLSLPEHQRRQLLYGDWDINEGAAFPEFNRKIHVVEPFNIPHGWAKFRAADYGYGSNTGVVWIAVSPSEQLIVYREMYNSKVTAWDLADLILEAEEGDNVRYGVLDSSLWHNRGDRGPSLAEQMISKGCRWRPSDRSRGSRVAGKNELHRRLQVDPFTGEPRLVIFSTCKNLIAQLPSIPLDKNNPEDVDTNAEDHLYDALRYGIMSRPKSSLWDYNPATHGSSHKVVDEKFGY